jgi:hypothetical protein
MPPQPRQASAHQAAGDSTPDGAACAVPALERALAERLAQGLPLDAQSLECILQSLGEDDPARAFALLAADPDSAEHAPLLALAFSPGEETRQELEPALAQAAGPGGRERTGRQAGRALPARCQQSSARPAAAARSPPRQTAAGPLPPGEALAGMRGGLRAAVAALGHSPAALLRVLAGRERAQADQLAAQLRHGRLNWTPCREFLMATLLERAGPEDELPALTAWMLSFLDLAGEAFEPRQALAARAAVSGRPAAPGRGPDEARERASFEVLAAQACGKGTCTRQACGGAGLVRARRAAHRGGLPKGDGTDGDGIAGRVRHRDLGGAEDAEALLRLLAGPVAGPEG